MFDPTQLLNAFLGANSQAASQQGAANQPSIGGLLGGLLSQGQGLLEQLQQPGGAKDVAIKIFGQATQGLQDATGKMDSSTGLGSLADHALKNLTGGQGLSDLLAKAGQLAGQNQLATGATLGGLASLVLGTSIGRGVAFDAAKLGGLAMIGGLAYNAWQNYTSASLMPAARTQTTEAPAASPFGTTPDADADKKTSLLLLRTMIAAAASDGQITNEERSNIVGGLSQAGLDVNSAKFLDDEFRNPASVDDLTEACDGPEMATQIYTAARLAIHGNRQEELDFLKKLAEGLGLDANLIAHIEATTVAAKGH